MQTRQLAELPVNEHIRAGTRVAVSDLVSRASRGPIIKLLRIDRSSGSTFASIRTTILRLRLTGLRMKVYKLTQRALVP